MSELPKLRRLRPGDNIAIDPGNIGSGWVVWRGDEAALGGLRLVQHVRTTNTVLRRFLGRHANLHSACHLQIEAPRPSGMAVGAETMEMMIQMGRILQMWRGPWTYVFRMPVKVHLCGSAKAKDGNVIQAIKDRFGGDSVAIGGKKCPRCKGTTRVGRARCPHCLRASQSENDCKHCDGGRNKQVYEKGLCVCAASGPEAAGWERKPGPLFGVADHEWHALAVAIYWLDLGEQDVHQIAGQQNVAKQKRKWRKKGGKK